MIRVHVKDCSDGMLWYADYLDQSFTLIRDLPSEKSWLVRASDGYSNIVRYSDGVITDCSNVVIDDFYQE